MRKIVYIPFLALALLFASAVSYAIAGTAAPQPRTVTVAVAGVIKACKNNKTGALYVLAKCPKGDSAVTWNQKGPAGAAGLIGQVGWPGSSGVAGATGAAGNNGTNGTDGTSATVSVGTVSTGAPGSSTSITNVGTSVAAKLNFSIPGGATGSVGTAGAPGTASWGTPVVMANYHNTGTRACPYVASSGTTPGTPATVIDFNGSAYEFTGQTCKYASTTVSGPSTNDNTPDVDPSDWTEIAARGQNAPAASAWAIIDPGTCAAGASCATPVIASGGVPGEGVGFDYLTVGQYRLTVTGCPGAETPASGHVFPLDVQVTPEGAYPNESPNDSSATPVASSVRDTTSLGVFSGLGVVEFYLYLGTPDHSTVGLTDSVTSLLRSASPADPSASADRILV